MFWIIATGLAALVLLPVLTAIWGGRAAGSDNADLAIYRDQLAEVDRDLARGVLRPDEAERTRLEVQRRLLDADRAASGGVRRTPRWAKMSMAAVSVALIVAGGFAIYVWIGAPGYRDLPMATRIALSQDARAARPSQAEAEAAAAPHLAPPRELEPDFARLMTRLRQTLEQRPDDIAGFRLLARNEAAAGNLRAARIAQDRLVALMGEDVTAEELAILSELMIYSANGQVTDEAEALADRALALDPGDGRALYLKGLALAQIGRTDRAFGYWRAALEAGPSDAPWIATVRLQLPELAARAGIRYTPEPASPTRGPSAEDVAAAQDMSPEDRAAMIAGMVEGLSQRLAEEGGPAPDWAQLIVALGALGETDRARVIFEEAGVIFAESPSDLETIRAAGARAGLDG